MTGEASRSSYKTFLSPHLNTSANCLMLFQKQKQNWLGAEDTAHSLLAGCNELIDVPQTISQNQM